MSPHDECICFDVPRAISLGAAAFKAYADPKLVHCYEDVTVEDTTLMVLDKDFLADAFCGVLEVQVERASNLPSGVPGELLAAPHVAAVVTLVSSRSLDAHLCPYKFTSADVSREPTWDQADRQAMLFPVREPDTDVLKIELFDEAPYTKRSSRTVYRLGTATVRLSELLQQQAIQERVLPLDVPCGLGEDLVGGSTVSIKYRLHRIESQVYEQLLARLTVVKTLPMSWDAPMQIGLNVVKWLRRSAFEEVTWQYLRDAVEMYGGKVGDLTPLAFIDNSCTNTEAWVFVSKQDRRVVVAFRGTSEFADWLMDLWVVPTPDKDIRPRNLCGGAHVDPDRIRVHQGFLKAYKSVRKTVLEVVDDVLRLADQPELWKVELTGHSLGGALATLAAYDIAWNKYEREHGHRQDGKPTIGSVTMVTFGAPRVGNNVFAKDFNSVVRDAWRVHNLNDIVSSVPFTFGFWNFSHIGKDVRVALPQNEWKVADHEIERWMASKVLSSTPISSHLEFRYKDTMLKIVRKWTEGRKVSVKKE